MLESLRTLQEQLHGMNIPLVILTAEKRAEKGERVLEFLKQHKISHVFANLKYEVDELRRDIHLVDQLADRGLGASFNVVHDQTAIDPKALTTGSGGPIKVFTPYHKHGWRRCPTTRNFSDWPMRRPGMTRRPRKS